MSAEVFVYLEDGSPRRSLAQLQADLASAGVRCRAEDDDTGPVLVLEGYETDMTVTVDTDGTATSAMVQLGDDPPDVLDRLFAEFERLGWVIADEDE